MAYYRINKSYDDTETDRFYIEADIEHKFSSTLAGYIGLSNSEDPKEFYTSNSDVGLFYDYKTRATTGVTWYF